MVSGGIGGRLGLLLWRVPNIGICACVCGWLCGYHSAGMLCEGGGPAIIFLFLRGVQHDGWGWG